MPDNPRAIGAKYKHKSNLLPKNPNDVDLGSPSNSWKTLYVGNLVVSGNAGFGTEIHFDAALDLALIPSTNILRIRNDDDTQWQSIEAENIVSHKADNSAGFTVELDGTNKRMLVAGIKVVGEQGVTVAQPSGGGTIDSQARTAINALIARLQSHGLIAT